MRMTRERLTRQLVCDAIDNMNLKDLVDFVSERLHGDLNDLSEYELIDEAERSDAISFEDSCHNQCSELTQYGHK